MACSLVCDNLMVHQASHHGSPYLSFGQYPNLHLPIFIEGHDRGGRAGTFRIFYNPRVFSLHDGNTGVRSAKINANDGPFDVTGRTLVAI